MHYSNDLENSLAQYDSNSKQATTMSKMRLSTLNARKLLSYTAAASSAFVFSATADAAVIYSGVQNVGLDTPVDINGDGIFDVSMTISSFATATSATNTASLNTPNNAAFIGQPGGNQVAKLSAGSNISAGALFKFTDGSFRIAFSNTSSGFAASGPWNGAPGSSGFAGLKIADGPTDIFAWLRFSVTNDNKGFPVDVTLIDWAYEDTGASILAGQTVSAVPLPGSLGLLAMGISGLAAFRRRKTTTKK